MKLYAPVTDVVRGEPIGYVVKTDTSVICVGLTEAGMAWADDWNSGESKSLTSDLPIYAKIGEFGHYTEGTEATINLVKHGIKTIIPSGQTFKFINGASDTQGSTAVKVKDCQLIEFDAEHKTAAVEYKAHAFRVDAQRSSAMFLARSVNAGINDNQTAFKTRPFTSSITDIDFIEAAGGSSNLRRATRDVAEVKSAIISMHPGYFFQDNTIENFVQVKRLGGNIGRRGRSVARFATARFDPHAIDGDNDGLVQEGTAFERPGLPNAPKAPDSLRGRQRAAAAERTGGLRSGSKGKRKLSKASKDAPGIKPVSENDGKIFQSMTEDQRSKLKEAVDKEISRIMQDLAKKSPSMWSGIVTLRNEMGTYTDSNDLVSYDVRSGAEITGIQDYFDQVVVPHYSGKEKGLDQIAKWQRAIDNLKTLRNMRENKTYEMLEHLHPTSRNKVIQSVDPTLRGSKQESSIFGVAGGLDKSKFAAAVEGTENIGMGKVRRAVDTRQRSFAQRVLRPNPERERRRALRAQRRSGVLRRARGADVERERTLSERIARSKRNLMRKLRKQRTAADLDKAIAKKTEQHPLKRDKNGVAQVDEKFVDFLAFVSKGIDARKQGQRTSRGDNDVLLDSWENAGFNELPEQVSDDELQHLVDNGWQFMARGMGREFGSKAKQNDDGTWSIGNSRRVFKSEDAANQYSDAMYKLYAQSYVEDEERFAPGRGASVHGIGEYWAPSGSSHFGGYGGGLVGAINPKARTKTRQEMAKIQADHSLINNEIRRVLASYPSGEDASKADPKEFVDAVRDALKQAGREGLLESSEMGPIMNQILSMYETSTPNNRPNIWQAIQYLAVMDKWDTLSAGYYAPVLGIDAIHDGNQVTLVHNRGAVAVLPEPVGAGEMRAIRDKMTRKS